MRAERAAITIDVDSLGFYHEIHGLPPRADEAPDPIYTVALPRFFELVEKAKVPPTLFLVGKDAPRYAQELRPLAALGAEVASHSFAHDYRLTRQTPEAIRADLARADEVLRPLAPSGHISGFRAPGYNTSPELLSAVRALGYTYDSSLLPSPLYFGARAAAIGLYAALQRPSRSLVGDLRAFAGAFEPRRIQPEAPWRAASDGTLVELPMACEPWTRAPLIGTSWVLAHPRLRRWMLERTLAGLRVVNFEMHAIDLLDGTDPGVTPALVRAQKDLAVPVREKMQAFEALFGRLAAETRVETLAALAASI